MSNIVAFLLARLAEDEQVARAATPGGWFWDAEAECFSTSARTESLDDHSWPATVVGAIGEHTSGFVLVEATDAAHITRFDPARVLAEVEAKRRIIEHEDHWAEDDRVLHLLALPYREHPDYRPAWAPEG